ncbi:MAG: hypothetical protein VX290_16370 [Candidatus Latescibacterota bacterium]|nr:hypothetical protein [Candidatus Latescibacterota bacterium]
METTFAPAGLGVFLLIVCLITRESTEAKLRSMRMELMGLRSKERTLAEQVKAIQKTESQIRAGMMRMSRKEETTGHVVIGLFRKLTTLYEFIRQEPMPPVPDPDGDISREEVAA